MPKLSPKDLVQKIESLEKENNILRQKNRDLLASQTDLQSHLTTATQLKEKLDEKNTLLFELSRTDGLTGLYNHQYIMSRCEHEFKRSIRYGSPLSCLMIDIDHFKLLNDTYGHQFGDFVLQELALLLKQCSRSVDIIGRYGGEEFLILVHRREEKAFEYISRFHHLVEQHRFKKNDLSAHLTVSVGIAELKNEIPTYQELIERADQALYQAKDDGRNLIRIWAKHDHGERALDTGGIEKLKKQFDSLSKEVKETYLQSTNALLKAIDARDHYTLLHSTQVADYAVLIATEMKLSPQMITVIRNAALLHDIGKIGIEESILTQTTPLTEEEFKLLKRHSVIGVNILKDIRFLEQEIPFILHHHERYDGKGYPHGLKDRSIPLGAKVLAVADAYAAMTTDRTFQKKKSQEEAIVELISEKGKQFDPEVVEILIKALN